MATKLLMPMVCTLVISVATPSVLLADVPTAQNGVQDLLIILSRFSGQAFGDTISLSLAGAMADSINTWFQDASYNHAASADSAITRSTRKVVGWYTLPSDGNGDVNHRINYTRPLPRPSLTAVAE